MSTGLKILPLGAGSMGSRRPRDLTLMMACPQAPTRRCGTLAERSEAGYAAERGAFVAAIRGGRPREHGRADDGQVLATLAAAKRRRSRSAGQRFSPIKNPRVSSGRPVRDGARQNHP